MKINKNLDTGPICNSYKVDILPNDNAEIISSKLSSIASQKILSNIDDIFDEKVEFKDQLHNEATYANKIEKSEGKIDWKNSAQKIIGKISGLYPSPGAWFVYKGERYKILKAELGDGKGKVGDILSDYLEICCNSNSIKVLEIQRQGKRPQNINEFMLGSKIKKGLNIQNV